MELIDPDEEAELAEIVRGFLALQARTATEGNSRLRRGVHAKGVCVRAVFEVLDVRDGRDPALASRLARGVFCKPVALPAIVRFSNASPALGRDAVDDVRGMAFRVEPAALLGGRSRFLDFSLQSAPTLPFNDTHELAVFSKVFTAPNPAVALGSLLFEDQMTFARTMRAASQQKRQRLLPYQQLRYWSAAPFRHGTADIVKYSAWPAGNNLARPLNAQNRNALQDELLRHVNEDDRMSEFEFGLQLLDIDRMIFQGRRRNEAFWIDNTAVEWPETQAPFHTVARLTLVPSSQVDPSECESLRIDTGGNCLPEFQPIGRMSEIRRRVVQASQRARTIDHNAG